MSSSEDGDDEKSYSIHFFKVILQRTLQEGKLMIPRSFVMQYGKELSNPVILILPNGDKWTVHWTKRDCDIWLNKGWEKFAQHYSLSHGNFLVFRYEGGSQLQVVIFNESGLEIDYPASTHDDEGEGANTFHEDDIALTLPNHKKARTDTWARGEGSVNAKSWSQNESNRRKNIEVKEGSTALERANKFKPRNPSFVRPLRQSYLQNLLILPASFSRKYMNELEGKASIVVSEDNNKRWTVRLKFNKSSNRSSLTTGWVSIVEEYKLKEGDVCVFEMIYSESKFVSFQLTIFRDTQVPTSHQLQDCYGPSMRKGE